MSSIVTRVVPNRRLEFRLPKAADRDRLYAVNTTFDGTSNYALSTGVRLTVSGAIARPRIERVAGCSNESHQCTSMTNVTLVLTGSGFVEEHARDAGRIVFVPASANATGSPSCELAPAVEHAKGLAASSWSRAACSLSTNDASGTFYVQYIVSVEGSRRGPAPSILTKNATVHFGPLVTGIAGCDGRPHRIVTRHDPTINGSNT
ncbi:MAG: hypothetical protein U5N53_00435 [Mycobacterium sp.]|nr:hypothetical protein [Mycobacterium sp.]